MSRKYTKIALLENEIQAMHTAGKTRREIAESLGLEKKQIKNWVNRHNRKERRLTAGILPKRQGRPRKNPTSENIVEVQAAEIKRLKMENELLRDFLQSMGRK